MNHSEPRRNDDQTSLSKIFALGFTPLLIAVLFYLSLSLCIQFSRYYSNRQIALIRYSEQYLIVCNPSVDRIDQELLPQVV